MAEKVPFNTAAFGINPSSVDFWLEMFRVLSETVSCGMIVSDMTIPGLPLVYINEGFRKLTGYGKEKIGTNCRFLQGKETEAYLNDEIKFALQQAEPLLVKLNNYKADGEKFQCLLALIPIMGPAPTFEYKFQIGLQIDFNPHDSDLSTKIAEMGRVLRLIPQSITGEKLPNVDAFVMETSEYFLSFLNGKANVNAAELVETRSSSLVSPQPPKSSPPSFISPRVKG
jgi:hypothetical protein